MNDEELLLQAANCPTMFFDGFGSFRKINGVLRCVGFIIGSGPQWNLIVSLKGAEAAAIETDRVLKQNATKAIHTWNGVAAIAH